MITDYQTFVEKLKKAYFESTGTKPTKYDDPLYQKYAQLIQKPTVLSDKELREKAAEQVAPLWDGKVEKVEIDAEGKLSTLNTSLEKKTLAHEANVEKTEKNFQNATIKTEDKAVRNGILNASIYGDMTESVKNDYLAKLKYVNEVFEAEKQNLETKIDLAKQAKEVALSYYEIKRAADIDKTLIKLKEQQLQAYIKARENNAYIYNILNNWEKVIAQQEAYKTRKDAEWEELVKQGKAVSNDGLEWEKALSVGATKGKEYYEKLEKAKKSKK